MGSSCHEQVWACQGFVYQVRAQAESVQHLVEHSCFRSAKGDQENWRFHYSRYLQVEDTHQTSNQGGQERDLWQNCYGQGEASEDNRESVSSGGHQENNLSVDHQSCVSQRLGVLASA